MKATDLNGCRAGLKYASAGVLIFICVIMLIMAVGCNGLVIEKQTEKQSGKICISIDEQSFLGVKSHIFTSQSVWNNNMLGLDTNNFILSIYSQNGSKVYSGKYGERPEEIIVVPGAYDIKLSSYKFNKPEFNSPEYGCEQTVIVEPNSTMDVTLECEQINAGIRLSFAENFKKKYLGEGIKICDSNGEITYPYSSYDFCYVKPGKIELFYTQEFIDTLLFSRQIYAREMLSLNLSYAPHSRSASLTLDMDTTRDWITEDFNTGLRVPTGAFTVEQAKNKMGEKNITVFGFIMGGDATELTIRVRPPFASRTNIIIASSMKERNRNNMFTVELPSGNVRDGLNLVSNRHLLGSAVVVTGNIVEKYFGFPGIRSTKSYSILY